MSNYNHDSFEQIKQEQKQFLRDFGFTEELITFLFGKHYFYFLYSPGTVWFHYNENFAFGFQIEPCFNTKVLKNVRYKFAPSNKIENDKGLGFVDIHEMGYNTPQELFDEVMNLAIFLEIIR